MQWLAHSNHPVTVHPKNLYARIYMIIAISQDKLENYA